MRRASTRSFELHQTEVSGPPFDKYAWILVLACGFVSVIDPLLTFGAQVNIQNAEPGLANRIFWPATMAISVAFALGNHSRLAKTAWPTHLTFLLVYIAFAGVSTLWAYKPETSFVRYAQQVMVVSSILLPGMLAARTTDLMRGVFICCAIGVAINSCFVFGGPASAIQGYSGYWPSKNALGEFSAVTLLLALNEMRYPGFRRALGIIVSILAGFLIVMSDSKTALALAFCSPVLAAIVLAVRRTMRISPAALLVSILLCYVVVSYLTGFSMYRVSDILYGDPTFTGRSYIWNFAFSKIADKPLLGWGYQSFWLVGSDAPSVVDAPGFVKLMPNAHNGYFDTMLELGYIGWGLLMVFILTTLHAIGRVADRDRGRAWSMLTIALCVVIYNGLESFWMRGYEFLWVVFLVLAVDIRRYLLPLPLTSAAERAIRSASPLTARVRLTSQGETSEEEPRISRSPRRGRLYNPQT